MAKTDMKEPGSEKVVNQGIPPKATSSSPGHESSDSNQERIRIRSGDSGFGHPDFEPTEARVLTEEEIAQRKAEAENEFRAAFERKLESYKHVNEFWQLPEWLRRFLFWALLFAASVAGLFVFVQSSQFVTYLSSLPTPFNWIGGFGVALFSGVIFFIVGWMLWLMVRLKQSPVIRIDALRAVGERERWRELAQERAEEAQKQLKAYLKEFPLSTSDKKQLHTLGVTEQEFNALVTARDRLLEKPKGPMSSKDWLREYAGRFQSVQDEVARRRINKYKVRAGIGTAGSPIAWIDQAIVLYSCTAMITDLLCLYHVRPAYGQSAILLARAILHTYLSGLVGEVTENVAENVADSVGDSVKEMSGEISGALGGSLISGFSAKATEGALNGYLVYRLGRRTMRMLQPVEAKKKRI